MVKCYTTPPHHFSIFWCISNFFPSTLLYVYFYFCVFHVHLCCFLGLHFLNGEESQQMKNNERHPMGKREDHPKNAQSRIKINGKNGLSNVNKKNLHREECKMQKEKNCSSPSSVIAPFPPHSRPIQGTPSGKSAVQRRPLRW